MAKTAYKIYTDTQVGRKAKAIALAKAEGKKGKEIYRQLTLF